MTKFDLIIEKTLKTTSSVMAILGAAIVYWVLMSNFLYSTVVFVHGEDLQMYICTCIFVLCVSFNTDKTLLLTSLSYIETAFKFS